MTDPEPRLLSIATGDLDHVTRLLARHRADEHPWCRECQSLTDHQGRCELQIALLGRAPAEASADEITLF